MGRVRGVAGGVVEPAEEAGALGEGVVGAEVEHVAAVGSDGDHGRHRLGAGQFLVVGAEREQGVRGAGGAVVVGRVQAEPGPQAGLALVGPAHLPVRPGTAQQHEGRAPRAHRGRGPLLGEEEQLPADGVDQDSGLDGVVGAAERLVAGGVRAQQRQQDVRAGQEVEVQGEGAPGVVGAQVAVGAYEDVDGGVAHHRPASARRRAAVFVAS
ncbi:hypothetical protein ACFXGI_18020 [Streptomyces sp. NPDC059355]|uniref:hypothetical protein n=1 Tax=Streptomyces sp. NPDC059355 TaxID=3346811 RepID=UPI0036942CF3